jgi:hypothetical protein
MYDHKEQNELNNSEKQVAPKVGIQRVNQNPKFQHELQLKEKSQKRNDTGLPDHLKVGIENLSGHSLDDVKVHCNSAKPAQLNAHAYAQGNQIHLAGGQEKHLAHEAWHVVQQKQGRVKPTVNVNGTAINDNVSLEKEADVMGGKALQMKVFENLSSPINDLGVGMDLPNNSKQALQRMEKETSGSEEYKKLAAEAESLTQDIIDIKTPSIDTFKTSIITKIDDFAKSEYAKYGGGYSYTPWYKDSSIPMWKRMAYRRCEDRRMGGEWGHVKYSKDEMEAYLNTREIEEEKNRGKATFKKATRKREVIQLKLPNQ